MAYTVRCQSSISSQSYNYFSALIADVLAYVPRTAGDILEVYLHGDIYGYIVIDNKLEVWWFQKRGAWPLTQSNKPL